GQQNKVMAEETDPAEPRRIRLTVSRRLAENDGAAGDIPAHQFKIRLPESTAADRHVLGEIGAVSAQAAAVEWHVRGRNVRLADSKSFEWRVRGRNWHLADPN